MCVNIIVSNKNVCCACGFVPPAVSCLPVAFPAALPGGGLRCVGEDCALVDDLHAGTAVFSIPLADAG